MADVFNRGNEIVLTPVNKDGVVGTTGSFGNSNRLVIRADGFSDLILSEETKRMNAHGGLLIQSFEMHQHDMLPKIETVLFGPTTVDLSAVEDKVRAALGLGPDDLLAIYTVKVEATGGKDKLTVNGVEVPI